MGKYQNLYGMNIYLPKQFGKDRVHLKSVVATEISWGLNRLGNNPDLQRFREPKQVFTPVYVVDPEASEQFVRQRGLSTFVQADDNVKFLGDTPKEDAIIVKALVYFNGQIEDLRDLQKIYRKIVRADIRNYFQAAIFPTSLVCEGSKTTMIFMFGDKHTNKKKIV